MSAISLGDLESQADRVELGTCCFMAAGLAADNSSGQTATVTLSGTAETGDVFTVTLNDTDYSFEVTETEDTLAKIATALAAVIDAAAAFTASAVGAVITVGVANAATGFTISVAATNVGSGTDDQGIVAAITDYGTLRMQTSASSGSLNGQIYALSAATEIEYSRSIVLPVSSFVWGIVCISTSAVTAYLGQIGVAALPEPPMTNGIPTAVVVGAFKIVTDATHTWTTDVTPLGATGITTTYYDLACIPVSGLPA